MGAFLSYLPNDDGTATTLKPFGPLSGPDHPHTNPFDSRLRRRGFEPVVVTDRPPAGNFRPIHAEAVFERMKLVPE